MSRRSVVPALALVLVAVAAFAAVAAAKSAPRPETTAGDYWETKFTTPTAGGETVIVSRNTIAGNEAVTVEGETYAAVKSVAKSTSTTTVSAGGSTFTLSSVTDTESWSRASDGAMLRVKSTTTSTNPFGGGGPQTTTTDTIYSPPCLTYEFPIEVGDAWESACHSKTTTNGQTTESDQTMAYRALREETVTVPAGSFDAIVVANGTGEQFLSYWAPKACAPVRTVVSSSAGSFSIDLQSYQCAKSGGFTSGSSSTPTPTPTPTTQSTTPPTGSTQPTPSTSGTGSNPTPTPTPSSNASGTPGFGVALVALAAGAAALLVARKRA